MADMAMILRPECLLSDGKRALVKRLGIDAIAALGFVQQGEIVEARGDIRMVWPECLLLDAKRALVERLGIAIAGLSAV